MTPNNTLALAPQSQLSSPVFDNLGSHIEAIEKLGNWLVKSGMINAEKPEQGPIMAMTCMIERISPVEFLKKYDIVGNRLSQKAASMLAEFRAKYGGEFRWLETGDDGVKASIWLSYKGSEMTVEYTMKEAEAAGLPGGKNPNWKTRKGVMLRARCSTKGLRMICPEIAAGVYAPEELEGIEEPKLRVATGRVAIEATAATPVDGLETSEIEALESLFERFGVVADEYFKIREWIDPAQNFRDLEPKRARKMIADPGPILAKLEDIAKRQAEILDGDFSPVDASAVEEGGAK